jgi:hypothetical protein
MTLGRPEGTNNPDGYDGPQNTIACPFCGKKVGNLPGHMRACDGENDE